MKSWTCVLSVTWSPGPHLKLIYEYIIDVAYNKENCQLYVLKSGYFVLVLQFQNDSLHFVSKLTIPFEGLLLGFTTCHFQRVFFFNDIFIQAIWYIQYHND
ncbi:hypothetical protein KSP39_PZI012897 [Platanthera zijinensis]|uniref:Uncharacterized protein n=1 Tax=Platanthera zijinensis TaxID=2320716 RepID=A0AAP0BBC4_9ASPA